MPRPFSVDFTGSPPAQGGGGPIHVPPGKYLLEVEKAEEGRSRQAQNRMLTVSFRIAHGDHTGKAIRDFFTLEGKSNFGKQRLHAFLLALDLPVGEKVIKFDLDRLTGIKVIGEIIDETRERTEEYDERIISRLVAYFSVKEAAEANAKAQQNSNDSTADTAIPVGAPATTAPPTDDEMADAVDDMFDF